MTKITDEKYSRRYFELKGRKAEEAVNVIAFKSFLREWCYCNPCWPDGKEICDLLVCFDKTAIIVQIKDIEFTGSEERYARKAFEHPLKQVLGADRKLGLATEPLRLTTSSGYEHDIQFSDFEHVHRLVLSVGDGNVPFNALSETDDGKIVHTFDRSIATVMNELDTVRDFTQYLESKEVALTSQRDLLLEGYREVDLLADHIFHNKSFSQNDGYDLVVVLDGIWEQLTQREEYLRKQQEDRISYFWDHLVDVAGHCEAPDYREIARELSSTTRFDRRFLSHSFHEAHQYAVLGNRAGRRIFEHSGVTYVFVFAPEDHPRTDRKGELAASCTVARDRFRDNSKVLGVATEYSSSGDHSYDFVLLDFPTWSTENQKRAASLRQKYGIMLNPTYTEGHMNEYPTSDADMPVTATMVGSGSTSPKKVGRNAPCSCGSGLKYKKCCGR